MKKIRVAVLIETSGGYGRAILAGVSRFLRTREDWSVFIEESDHRADVPEWICDWDGDGILSRSPSDRLRATVRRKRTPLVSLVDEVETAAVPAVRSDDREIGRLAAEHLLKIGHRRFAFCGFRNLAWSDRRHQGFLECLQQHGHSHCEFFATPRFGPEANAWDEECRQLEDWIQYLPKPIGLLACADIRGNQVTTACSKLGVAVPEEIAVVGVDNDQLICEVSSPRLTSVRPDAERIGFVAAETLAAMMETKRNSKANGRQRKVAKFEESVVVPPVGIAMRQSTDTLATDDKDVAKALRFIREKACSGVSVADVASNCSISRSTLERRMREAINRTPQQQIRHVQISRVCELLTESDESLAQIAGICGFEHAEYMHVVFKREMAVTPGEFRRTASENKSRFS